MFLPRSIAARAHCADREAARRSARRARARSGDAARRGARSDGAADGRRGRARGSLQHGGRSRDLLPDAARRWRLPWHPDPLAADGREDDDAGVQPRRPQRARARLGHRFRVSRPIAASCCRSGRSGTPASPGRRSGSIRRRGMFVVFLSNRVHPDGKGDVTPLRARSRDRRGVGDHRARRTTCDQPA